MRHGQTGEATDASAQPASAGGRVDLTDALAERVAHAETKFGPFASTHEAYGVLAEEMAELLDAIRGNNLAGVANEAVDVAAVAIRLATIASALAWTPFHERSMK